MSGWVNPHTGKGLLDSISQYMYLKKNFAKKNHFWNTKNKKNNNRNRKWILISSKKWILILKNKKKTPKNRKNRIGILKLVWIYNQFKELLIKRQQSWSARIKTRPSVLFPICISQAYHIHLLIWNNKPIAKSDTE